MADSISYLMDEHVPRAVTSGLLQRNLKAVTVQDKGLRETPDREILLFAREHQLILVTQDAHFLRLHKKQIQHSGIVYAPHDREIGAFIRNLVLIREILTPDEMNDHVEFI